MEVSRHNAAELEPTGNGDRRIPLNGASVPNFAVDVASPTICAPRNGETAGQAIEGIAESRVGGQLLELESALDGVRTVIAYVPTGKRGAGVEVRGIDADLTPLPVSPAPGRSRRRPGAPVEGASRNGGEWAVDGDGDGCKRPADGRVRAAERQGRVRPPAIRGTARGHPARLEVAGGNRTKGQGTAHGDRCGARRYCGIAVAQLPRRVEPPAEGFPGCSQAANVRDPGCE